MAGWRRLSMVVLLGACELCVAARAGEDAKPAAPAPVATPAKGKKLTDQEKTSAKAKLRAKVSFVHLEAVQFLAGFPEPESAKLLYQFGLRDTDETVSRQSYATLLAFKDNREVCDWLIEQVNTEARRSAIDAYAPQLLGILLSSALADVEQSSQKYLDVSLAGHKEGANFAVNLADWLGGHGQATDVVPLTRLANSKLFDKFIVRRAVVRALSLLEYPQAVGALVALVPKLEGEPRADALEYLALVSKQKLVETEELTAWWAAQQATFAFPKPFMRPAARRIENAVLADTSQYYGLPLYGKRLVFVIDTSSSMADGRIEAAKRELKHAVGGLGTEVYFGIVAFNSHIQYWRKELVPANTANKLEAVKFVDRLVAREQTATYDALQAAFYFDAEAIYLLTDGDPTAGRIVYPVEIVAAIVKQNRMRRESVYTIGIAPGVNDSPMEAFLRALAEQNFGMYRRVDE